MLIKCYIETKCIGDKRVASRRNYYEKEKIWNPWYCDVDLHEHYDHFRSHYRIHRPDGREYDE